MFHVEHPEPALAFHTIFHKSHSFDRLHPTGFHLSFNCNV
jgi:hypothetical protein